MCVSGRPSVFSLRIIQHLKECVSVSIVICPSTHPLLITSGYSHIVSSYCCDGGFIQRKKLSTHETEPLFLYSPIKSETYSYGLPETFIIFYLWFCVGFNLALVTVTEWTYRLLFQIQFRMFSDSQPVAVQNLSHRLNFIPLRFWFPLRWTKIKVGQGHHL